MRCFLLGIVGFVLTAFVSTIAITSYGDFTARASLNETLVAVRPLRDKIGEALLKDPRAMAIPKESIPGVDFLKVSPDGTIVFRSTKHGSLIAYDPTVIRGAVTWKCVGAPAKDVPADCR